MKKTVLIVLTIALTLVLCFTLFACNNEKIEAIFKKSMTNEELVNAPSNLEGRKDPFSYTYVNQTLTMSSKGELISLVTHIEYYNEYGNYVTDFTKTVVGDKTTDVSTHSCKFVDNGKTYTGACDEAGHWTVTYVESEENLKEIMYDELKVYLQDLVDFAKQIDAPYVEEINAGKKKSALQVEDRALTVVYTTYQENGNMVIKTVSVRDLEETKVARPSKYWEYATKA